MEIALKKIFSFQLESKVEMIPTEQLGEQLLERLPEEWLEDTGDGYAIRRARSKDKPETMPDLSKIIKD